MIIISLFQYLIESIFSSSTQRANFLAASAAQYSGDWMFAFLIASRGLRGSTTNRWALHVDIRLGLNICVSHVCRCGALVDARGLHCSVCMRAAGHTSRNHALNDCWLVHLYPQDFRQLNNLTVSRAWMANAPIAKRSSLIRPANHSWLGISRSRAHWLPPTWTPPLDRLVDAVGAWVGSFHEIC